jgi:alkanesulfonate monooxygenase SsuD/methylene tetrahydromethanopterin reductase-like flavin-dependent oxidoreductase (luciferase family)
MAERKVKLNVLFPTHVVLLWNKGTPDISPVIDLAVRTEELGYDSVFVGDSVLAKPRLEALSVLSAVAVKTSRVKLNTAIFLPCLRNPAFWPIR